MITNGKFTVNYHAHDSFIPSSSIYNYKNAYFCIVPVYINREWKLGMCQRDNNWIKEQKTDEGHQWVFNTTTKIGGGLKLAL